VVAAVDDFPDEVAIAIRRIFTVEPFLVDQLFTREIGVEAFVFDASEQVPSERSLPTLPMLETREALPRVLPRQNLRQLRWGISSCWPISGHKTVIMVGRYAPCQRTVEMT
jgi:hypothetical protein